MRSEIVKCTLGLTLFVVLVATQLLAQDRSGANRNQTHYVVKILSTLGGSEGVGEAITANGWISGAANLKDATQHAALWRNLQITDLGTLGGPNSRVVGGVHNTHGLVAGGSETATPDPLGETFCSTFVALFSGKPLICLGFVWQNGVMTALPTLGGNNSYALGGVNNLGQIVGLAEISTHDPACPSPQVLDFEAVVWGPKPGQILELPPLPGDTVGLANEINDHGQAVGATGLCSAFSTGIEHAVLWQDGSAIDLGNLGSQLFNSANTINERGEVAGGAGMPNNATWHAFLWNKGVMRDLGLLAGDVMSQSNGMNNKGQVVGTSCIDINFSDCRAFIWQNGVMTNLNDLIPPNSLQGIHLGIANDINDRGEIVGATVTNNGADGPGFVLFPCNEMHKDLEGCETWR